MKRTTKTELIMALAMLLVASVLLTSSSFAWFVISKQASAQLPEISMQGYQNIEIAKAKEFNYQYITLTGTTSPAFLPFYTVPAEVAAGQSGDQKYWGGVVGDFTGIVQMNPSEYDTTMHGVKLPSYGDDGRRNGYTKASKATASNPYSEDVYKVNGITVAATRYVWIRTNVEGWVQMVSGSVRMCTSSSLGITESYVSEHAVVLSDSAFDFGCAVVVRAAGRYTNGAGTYTADGVFLEREESVKYSGLAEKYVTDGAVCFRYQFHATANVPYLVEIITFYDGAEVTNEDALDDEYKSYYIDSFNWINKAITDTVEVDSRMITN